MASALCATSSVVTLAHENSVGIPVTELKFRDAGICPLKIAVGYGDIGKGAHGTFVKFPAGFASPLHDHTDDHSGVVISETTHETQPSATPRSVRGSGADLSLALVAAAASHHE